MNLSGIDLNLLVVFDALMQERHVTRAAARVGLSQSGMSNALGRLRDVLDDPVVVRSGGEMVPTHRASEMFPLVHEALRKMESALGQGFDPALSQAALVLAMPDVLEVVVLPALLARLRNSAPGIRVASRNLTSPNLGANFFRRGVDLAVGAILEKEHPVETLFHETFSVLFDPSIDSKRLSLARYCARPHVVWSPNAELVGSIDAQLKDLGRERRVVASSPSFLALPHLIVGSDRLATVPTHLALCLAEPLGLAVAPVPFSVVGFDIRLSWDASQADRPEVRWLRDEVRSAYHSSFE